jgi:hypothetical protein
MKMNRILRVFSGLCIVLIIACIPALADTNSQPVLPHAFYGSVMNSNGQPVSVGVAIEAKGTGILSGPFNPITITQAGTYGAKGGMDPNKLLVQGSVADGTPIEFYVGGVRAQCYDVAAARGWNDTYPFKSGEVTELNLQAGNDTVTITSTATATPTPTATQTSSGSYTGGGGGGGSIVSGGGTTAGSSSASGSSTTGTSSTGVTATATATVTSTPGNQGAGSSVTANPTQASQEDTRTPTQEMTTVATQPTSSGTSQMIPPLWGIGILVVIIIIAAGAYFYSRQKSQQKKE